MDVASLRRPLTEADPEIARIVKAEVDRQNQHLELIASENYCSAAVRAAMGSALTDKYAEGYPGKRWYEGCLVADEVERVAIDRATALFGADHANVQPHAGSQANMAAYMACLKSGDVILGMNLAHGGHLTHGHPLNFSGRMFEVHSYGVNRDTCQIDYEELRRLAEEHRPAIIVAGASSYSRTIHFDRFKQIADSVGARLMADTAHIAGLIAAKLHPDPVPHADFVTGTTHKTLRGPRSGFALCKKQYAEALDKAVFPGLQGGPLMHTIAAKAVAFREALQPQFREYQKRVLANAKTMAKVFMDRGYRVVSGGTDNHLFLVDVGQKGMTGQRAASLLSKTNITLNKNVIPFDTHPPMETSGIRIGSPAMTTRGMGVEESTSIAAWICDVLDAPENKKVIEDVRDKVAALCQEFPVFEEYPDGL